MMQVVTLPTARRAVQLPTLRLLVVDPESSTRALLEHATAPLAHVITYADFATARQVLDEESSLDFLITNVRLGAYNGLHLVHLAAVHGTHPRSIAYTDRRDVGLAKEAQRAGAFYEILPCLPVTIAAYLRGTLPSHDRREPAFLDRRTIFRDGRRCWDHHIAVH